MGATQSIHSSFENLEKLGFSLFQIACYRLDFDAMAMFLEKDPTLCDKMDERLYGMTPMIMCSAGYKKKMKKSDFMELKECIYAVKDSLKLSYQKAIKLLIGAGANINQKTRFGSLALWPILCGDFKTFQFFVTCGTDLKTQGEDFKSLIYNVAAIDLDFEFSKKVIEILLKEGVDIDSKKKNGKTALFAAIRRGNIKLVDFLLSNGASHSAVSGKWETPLHFAVSRKDCTGEMLYTLILHGADVNAQTSEDKPNVFMHALMVGRTKEILSFLIEQGSKTDLKFFGRATCLDIAVVKKYGDEIIDLLLDSGVNPYEKGTGGMDAFDIAKQAGVTYKRFESLKKEKEEHDAQEAPASASEKRENESES